MGWLTSGQQLLQVFGDLDVTNKTRNAAVDLPRSKAIYNQSLCEV